MNGFFRIASCVPELRVGDPSFNAARIADLYRKADAAGAGGSGGVRGLLRSLPGGAKTVPPIPWKPRR